MSVNPYYQPFFKQNNRDIRIPSLSQGIHNRPHELGNREYFGKWDDTEKAEISTIQGYQFEQPFPPNGIKDGDILMYNEETGQFEVSQTTITVRAATTRDLNQELKSVTKKATNKDIFQPRHNLQYQRRILNSQLPLNINYISPHDKAYGYDIITSLGDWKTDFEYPENSQNEKIEAIGLTIDGIQLGNGDLVLVKDSDNLLINTNVTPIVDINNNNLTDMWPNQADLNSFITVQTWGTPDDVSHGVYRVLSNGIDTNVINFQNGTSPDPNKIVLERIYLHDGSTGRNLVGSIRVSTTEGKINSNTQFNLRYRADAYNSYRETVKNIVARNGIAWQQFTDAKLAETTENLVDTFDNIIDGREGGNNTNVYIKDVEIDAEAGDNVVVMILHKDASLDILNNLTYDVKDSNYIPTTVATQKANLLRIQHGGGDTNFQLGLVQFGARSEGNKFVSIIGAQLGTQNDSRVRIINQNRLMGGPGITNSLSFSPLTLSANEVTLTNNDLFSLPNSTMFVIAYRGQDPSIIEEHELVLLPDDTRVRILNMHGFKLPQSGDRGDLKVDVYVKEHNFIGESITPTNPNRDVTFKLYKDTDTGIELVDHITNSIDLEAYGSVISWNSGTQRFGQVAKEFNRIDDTSEALNIIDSKIGYEDNIFEEPIRDIIFNEVATLDMVSNEEKSFKYDFITFSLINTNNYVDANNGLLGPENYIAISDVIPVQSNQETGLELYTFVNSKDVYLKDRMLDIYNAIDDPIIDALLASPNPTEQEKGEQLKRIALSVIASRVAVKINYTPSVTGIEGETRTVYNSYENHPISLTDPNLFISGTPPRLLKKPLIYTEDAIYAAYNIPHFKIAYTTPLSSPPEPGDIFDFDITEVGALLANPSIEEYIIKIPEEAKKTMQSFAGHLSISVKPAFPPIIQDVYAMPLIIPLSVGAPYVGLQAFEHQNDGITSQGEGVFVSAAAILQIPTENAIEAVDSLALRPVQRLDTTLYNCRYRYPHLCK